MKIRMFALIGTAAGVATAFAVHQGAQLMAHHSAQEEHLKQMMYAQVSPLEQQLGQPGAQAPEGILPLDASPMPGVPEEPGSMRPAIQLKPGANPPRMNTSAQAVLILKKTDKTIKGTKDPIWSLELVNNQNIVLETLPALTGRAYRQTANRNTAGNKSPLPKGIYRIDRLGIASAPFDDPELGRGYWVPVTPLFATGRSALGFHQDPSWGKLNGESGTSGCIGLESAEATIKLVTWIKHYNITKFVVES
jgi:hypothetical protein